MIKAVKKLKLWSRKKRKRKTLPPPPPPYDPPPPPPRYQCHFCCPYTVSSSTTRPSAPPLPPWMDYTDEIDTLQRPAPLELAFQPLSVPRKQESTAPALNMNPTSSYHQYMVQDPVYGVPAQQASKAAGQISAGFFGSVVDYLVCCFFPCFCIREVIK